MFCMQRWRQLWVWARDRFQAVSNLLKVGRKQSWNSLRRFLHHELSQGKSESMTSISQLSIVQT